MNSKLLLISDLSRSGSTLLSALLRQIPRFATAMTSPVAALVGTLVKNPLQLSRMFNFQPDASLYARVETLMNSDNGLIGLSWSNLREAWFGAQPKRLIVVPYDHLAKAPARTLQRLYTELGEAHFEHDFNNVVYDEPD